jgi:predicted dehydrogenase
MTRGVAIIGAGLVGEKRAAALPAGTELRTVFDPVPDRARAVADTSPAATVAATVEAAIDDRAVSLVIVATPHGELARIGVAALARGRHVLVEKPGGDSLHALLELREAARAAGRRVRVGFNHRFHPAVVRTRDEIRSGRYGQVFGIRARYGHGGRVGYEREWRARRDLSGGGELVDQGLHLIDLVRYLTGEVELAFSELRTDFWPVEVEDNAYLALRTASGAFAWLHASWTEWKNLFSLEVAMRTAKLEVTGLGGSYGVERFTRHEMLPEMGPPKTTSTEWPTLDRSWAAELDDVLADLDGRPATGAGVDDAIAAFRVVNAAYARKSSAEPSPEGAGS